MMIISRGHARRLVRQGRATLDGSTIDNDQRYQIVTRHDLQRTDHYPLFSGQLATVAVHEISPGLTTTQRNKS
jgi:hypothetical protein